MDKQNPANTAMLAFATNGRRIITQREERIVEESLREFSQQQTWRATFASHWEEVSELIDPPSRNTFMYGNFNWPGQKKTERQVDASGMLALGRFGAICDSLLTPRNMFWHGLQADDDYVNKQRGVKLYFEQVTKILFKHRYRPTANFSAQNQGIYRSLGAYGTGAVFIDEYDTRMGGTPGLRYKNVPLGELFIRENHQGVCDGFTRWFRLTAQQAYQKWPDTFPEVLLAPLQQMSTMTFNFLHRVCPRDDYDPQRLDHLGKRWASYYISLEGKCLLSEGGYHNMPTAVSRYDQTPGEMYGRSPAMSVLPALKTLNAEKRTFLKQGHRIADPVLFTSDDGVVDASLRPGALNKGGVSADGKLLVATLPTGNIQINEKMMAEEKSLINDAFLVTLFQILTETPQMTATEVIERTNEKGILLAPTVGRQQSEYLGPLIEREIVVLANLGLLPPMPEVLREAQGEYSVVYTSPLSRAMRAQEAAGFIRSVEVAKEIVNITQDPSFLDPFDFDVAMPEIADINGTPISWMASDEKIAAKRKQRADAQQRQEQIQAAPAAAAMMKARAAQQKAGGPPPPGQLPAEGGKPLAEQVGG
jgi:hypothetical protein